MANKLEDFLKTEKIDRRRVIAVSKQLEHLRPEDRAIKLTQRKARKSEDGKKPEGLAKPRSGRPVTGAALDKALAGKPLSGPQRTRILKAVNHILAAKKKSAVTIDKLFDVTVQNPPKPKEPKAEG